MMNNLLNYASSTADLVKRGIYYGMLKAHREAIEQTVEVIGSGAGIKDISASLCLILYKFVSRPVSLLDDGMRRIARGDLDHVVEDLEKAFLIDALVRYNWNITRAAEGVGMQRTNFHALMKRYKITKIAKDS